MRQQHTEDADSIGDVVAGIEDVARDQDTVAVGDVIEAFGDRSFAPFMLILGLVGTTPVGAIPGVPSFIALSIALVAGQLLLGRRHIWLPSLIAERSVSSEKLSNGTEKLEKIAAALDRLTGDRLQFLTKGPALQVAALIIILLCCAVPVLELVPLAAAIPFLSIAILSLSLMVRDGLVMLAGGAIAAAALGFGSTWLAG